MHDDTVFAYFSFDMLAWLYAFMYGMLKNNTPTMRCDTLLKLFRFFCLLAIKWSLPHKCYKAAFAPAFDMAQTNYMIWFGCVSYSTHHKYAVCYMKIQFCAALPFSFIKLPVFLCDDYSSIWQLFFFSPNAVCFAVWSLVFDRIFSQWQFLVWKLLLLFQAITAFRYENYL